MNGRTFSLAAVALALGGCGALDGRDGFDRRVYVGAGALVSQLEPDADDDPVLELDEDTSAGGSIALGYDLGGRFSIEGHVAALGEATFEPAGEVAYQVGGVSALLYGLADADARALREGFSVFGRLGVGAMRNQADDVAFERVNDVHLLAGLGVEYGLEMGLALRGEVVAHERDAKYAQLALVYRFGEARRGGRRASSASAPTSTDSPADESDRARATPAPVPVPETPPATALDGDDDGIADVDDRCPETVAGHPVDESGCDLFGGPVEGLGFESGSDALTAEAESVLDGIAAALREYPDVVVSIGAHTDNRGSAETNLELARRRALAVARYLAAEGVESGRLEPKAFGESRPIASNASADGRARNRRVEIAVVE